MSLEQWKRIVKICIDLDVTSGIGILPKLEILYQKFENIYVKVAEEWKNFVVPRHNMGSIWNKMANCCKLVISLTKSKMRWCSDISLTNRTISRSNIGVTDFWTSRHFSALKIRSEILKNGKKYRIVCLFVPKLIPKLPPKMSPKCPQFILKLGEVINAENVIFFNQPFNITWKADGINNLQKCEED